VITEKDLHEAIAECQGERNPNANTCIKLAAYYTILENLNSDTGYSRQSDPIREIPVNVNIIDYDGVSEFAQAVHGKNTYEVMALMDELMQILSATNPPLYNGVMRRM
jgi:NADH/NAD ratio-sensing transcriptional regulator Rex